MFKVIRNYCTPKSPFKWASSLFLLLLLLGSPCAMSVAASAESSQDRALADGHQKEQALTEEGLIKASEMDQVKLEQSLNSEAQEREAMLEQKLKQSAQKRFEEQERLLQNDAQKDRVESLISD